MDFASLECMMVIQSRKNSIEMNLVALLLKLVKFAVIYLSKVLVTEARSRICYAYFSASS